MSDAPLHESSIGSLDLIGRGKVRDLYAVDDEWLLIVASDRLSAFDVVLPDPIPGEPTRIRPAGTRANGSWPPTILPEDLHATEADIYGGSERTSNVRAAMSLHPDSVRWLSDLFDAHYLSWVEIQSVQEPFRVLTRPQRELVAARVSALNECFY